MSQKRKLATKGAPSKRAKLAINHKKNTSLDPIMLSKAIENGHLCGNNCLDKFRIGDIKAGRNEYHSLDEVDKMNWLIQKIKVFYDKDSKKMSIQLKGSNVCWRAFVSYYGVTQYKWY